MLLSDFKDDASQLLKGSKKHKITVKYPDKANRIPQIKLDEVEIKS
jgi:carboxyl-terminal processing protease